MEVQQQESPGILDVSKREFSAALSRVRAKALTPQNEQHRRDLLHRYRMGFAISGGGSAGLMVGHASSVAILVVLCLGLMIMAALCFASIDKIQNPEGAE